MIRRMAAASVLAAGLAACGGSGSSSPHSTAAPPAVTPSASAHSVQAVPVPVSPSAAVIAGLLKSAGQPITGLIVYNEVTDPNHLLGRQGGYTSKVAWQDPPAEAAGDVGQPSGPDETGSVEFGGGIEVFPDAANADARYTELKGFTAPFGDGYDYLTGTAVLRLSQYLTPAQASAYYNEFSTAAA